MIPPLFLQIYLYHIPYTYICKARRVDYTALKYLANILLTNETILYVFLCYLTLTNTCQIVGNTDNWY